MTCCYRYNDHLSIGRYQPSQSVRWWGLPLIGQMAHTLASDWSPPAPGEGPDVRWWEYCRSCHVNWADNLKIRTLLPDNFWWPPIFLCLRLTEDREERRWLTWVLSYPRFLWLWETIWVLSNCRVPIMTSNEFWVPISKVVKLMNCLLENVNVGTAHQVCWPLLTFLLLLIIRMPGMHFWLLLELKVSHNLYLSGLELQVDFKQTSRDLKHTSSRLQGDSKMTSSVL